MQTIYTIVTHTADTDPFVHGSFYDEARARQFMQSLATSAQAEEAAEHPDVAVMVSQDETGDTLHVMVQDIGITFAVSIHSNTLAGAPS